MSVAGYPAHLIARNPDALVKYNWCGVAFGVYCERTIITGDRVVPGMSVMALRETGLGNNGISSARKAIIMRFKSYSNPKAQPAIRRAATHSLLYDKFLVAANGWNNGYVPLVPIRMLAHLTGGGLKGKFVEDMLFPRGLSATLDNLWNPPAIMRQCAKWRGMNEKECYETWHGGQRVLAVIDREEEKQFVALARSFGLQARRAGEITKRRRPTVTVTSKFSGKKLTWHAK